MSHIFLLFDYIIYSVNHRIYICKYFFIIKTNYLKAHCIKLLSSESVGFILFVFIVIFAIYFNDQLLF